jgi:hypothetical protein
MAFVYDDRVKVTATAPGTGAIPAASPAAAGGFIQLSAIAGIANGDIVSYTIADGATLFEDGFGTWNSVTGLTRTTVTSNSSRNTSAINFTGAVTVTCNVISASLKVPTRQVLKSGSAATYTTPVGVRQLRIRMVGGGGGAGGNGSSGSGSGTGGGNTIFNSINAAGGGGAPGADTGGNSVGGLGGTGGSGGTSPTTFRAPGFPGTSGQVSSGNGAMGGTGGGSLLGGGGRGVNADAGAANSGGGGGGANNGSIAGALGGPGGGGGEYVEIIINNPAGTYTYTIGAGGAGGGAGIAGTAGAAGGSGVIIVDEIYI